MNQPYRKRADFERQLIGLLWKHGWAAMRAAGSGSTKWSVPDVLAVKNGRVLAFECKSTTKDRLSLKGAVEGIKEFSYVSGAKTYLAVKFNREKPRFYDIIHLILDGNYTVKDTMKYETLETVLGVQGTLKGHEEPEN
ncbi:Holliday junction resolvase Hjc [uncultured archaeon]|nr:Holliday junction resolvase Hjc [uncultured archaeon]